MARLFGWLLLCTLPACAVIRVPLGPDDRIHEVTLMGEGDGKILLLDVSGLLSFRRPWVPPGWPQEPNLPERLRGDLDRARRDPSVRGVLVRVDSPGGTVTASDVLFHEIRSFREERGVPVVASIVEKGLSGGYYVALAADEIHAHPTSLVGSVGVFVAKIDASELLGRWGVQSEITKSGPQKDLLSPLRPLTDPERETLRAIVADLQGQFAETLRAARPQVGESELEAIGSAAPFTARRALELGLIDRVGYLEDAFLAVRDRAGLPRARLVAYRRGVPSAPNPYSLAGVLGSLSAEPLFLDPLWVDGLLGGTPRY